MYINLSSFVVSKKTPSSHKVNLSNSPPPSYNKRKNLTFSISFINFSDTILKMGLVTDNRTTEIKKIYFIFYVVSIFATLAQAFDNL